MSEIETRSKSLVFTFEMRPRRYIYKFPRDQDETKTFQNKSQDFETEITSLMTGTSTLAHKYDYAQ